MPRRPSDDVSESSPGSRCYFFVGADGPTFERHAHSPTFASTRRPFGSPARSWSMRRPPCRTAGSAGPTSLTLGMTADRRSATTAAFRRIGVDPSLPHNDLDAEAVVAELCTQAAWPWSRIRRVMTSEHTAASPATCPIRCRCRLLLRSTPALAAPCPSSCPSSGALVPRGGLARRRTRPVGLASPPGPCRSTSRPWIARADAVPRFVAELPALSHARGPRPRELHGTRLQRCSTCDPLLSAAASPSAARRAASCGRASFSRDVTARTAACGVFGL